MVASAFVTFVQLRPDSTESDGCMIEHSQSLSVMCEPLDPPARKRREDNASALVMRSMVMQVPH